jgi:hypothetical protein
VRRRTDTSELAINAFIAKCLVEFRIAHEAAPLVTKKTKQIVVSVATPWGGGIYMGPYVPICARLLHGPRLGPCGGQCITPHGHSRANIGPISGPILMTTMVRLNLNWAPSWAHVGAPYGPRGPVCKLYELFGAVFQ